MNSLCQKCNELLIQDDLLRCALCNINLHFACAGYNERSFRRLKIETKENWCCTTCLSIKNKESNLNKNKTKHEFNAKSKQIIENKVDDEMEIQKQGKPLNLEESINTILHPLINESQQNLIEQMKELISNSNVIIIDEINKKINNYHSEIKNEIESILNKINVNCEEINKLKSKVTSIDVEITKYDNENQSLKKKLEMQENNILGLNSQINDLQQYMRKNNVIITNLPEQKNENLLKYFEKIASNHNLKIENIEIAHRITTRKKEDKGRPIIVKFKSNSDKQTWKKTLKLAQMTSKDFYPDLPQQKVFINDHLSAANRILFNETRLFKKQFKFEFVWTANGKVFLRQNNLEKPLHIKSSADLDILKPK